MIAGSTIIKLCTCKSEHQDYLYGKWMRVHNVGKDDSVSCTGCVPPRSMQRIAAHGRQHDKRLHG